MFCLQSTQVLNHLVFLFQIGLKYYTIDYGICEDRLMLKHFILRQLSRLFFSHMLLKGFMFEHWYVPQHLTNCAWKMVSLYLEENFGTQRLKHPYLQCWFNWHHIQYALSIFKFSCSKSWSQMKQTCNAILVSHHWKFKWEDNLYSTHILARINNNHCWTCTQWVSFQTFLEALIKEA